MKRFILLTLMVCFVGSYALAQGTRTKALPPAGAMQTTDKVVIDRNVNGTHTTMLANAPFPTGSIGDILTNIGNNIYGAISRYLGYGIPSNQWSALYVFGDANANNNQGAWFLQSFGSLVAKSMGSGPVYYNINNFSSFSCDVVDQKIIPNVNPGSSSNPAMIWLPNPSDVTWGGPGGVYTSHLADTQTCATGALTWATISADNKVYGQNFTSSGTWTNNTHYTIPKGITSNTNGDTLTATITTYGGPVYLWYLMNGNNGGTFTYKIDGGAASSTIPTQGNNQFTFPISTANFSLGAVRIPATGTLVAGSHTIQITVTSITSVSNTVTIEGIGTSAYKAYSSKAPMMVVGGQIPNNTTYPAASIAFNSMYRDLSASLVSDGLIAPFADVQLYFSAATDLNAGSGLTALGQTHIAQAFTGILQPVRNTDGSIDPRDFGASCNSLYLHDGAVTNYTISTTALSPEVSIANYTFKDGVATQTGGGDKGRRFCIGPGGSGGSEGPCTYIQSINTTTNKATLAQNSVNTKTDHYGVMGGYPTNPADMSTAADDTLYVQAAGNAALLNGGKVHMPPNCMVHDLNMPTNIIVEGNSPGSFYGHTGQELTNVQQATTINCGITGMPDDTLQCIRANHHTLFKDLFIRCPTFPFTNYRIAATALGYSTTGTGEGGPGAQALTQNLSFYGCPVDIGQAFGYSVPVTFTGSISDNGDGTSTMNVTAGISTNFWNLAHWTANSTNVDNLGMNRYVTGPGVTANTKIISMPHGGFIGDYIVNKAMNVTSTTLTSPAVNLGMELRDNHSQHYTAGIGYNGDMSDCSIEESICTGTFMKACWLIGPNIASYGSGGCRWKGGRIEEMGYAGIICDGSQIYLDGVDLDFNTGFNVLTQSTVATSHCIINHTGGWMLGGGHGNTPTQDKAMYMLGGDGTSVHVGGVMLGGWDAANGGTTGVLFSTSTGATLSNMTVSVAGGNAVMPGGFFANITGLYNWTNGTPAKYSQRVSGFPVIDTFNKPATSGLTLTSSSLGSYDSKAITSTTTSAGNFTISSLPIAPNGWNCDGGSVTLANSWPLSASTSTSCVLKATTTGADEIWWSNRPRGGP